MHEKFIRHITSELIIHFKICFLISIFNSLSNKQQNISYQKHVKTIYNNFFLQNLRRQMGYKEENFLNVWKFKWTPLSKLCMAKFV